MQCAQKSTVQFGWMALLRIASLLVVALWVGGLAALGFVAAPEIFSTLEKASPAAGRGLAGEVFGAVLTRFQHWAWFLGALLIALLITRALLGPRPRRLALRVWGVLAMLALSIVTALVLAPRIDRIRLETNGAVAALPDADARRIEFRRLHALSNVFMLLTLAGGVGLLWAETKDSH
jgi:multisubunit Na+/H+ antiporter MnhG subunit